MPVGHATGPEGQRHGHDRRQSFRDGGHGQAHCGEEHLVGRFPANEAADEHGDAHDDGSHRHAPADHGEALLQRGRRRSGAPRHAPADHGEVALRRGGR